METRVTPLMTVRPSPRVTYSPSLMRLLLAQALDVERSFDAFTPTSLKFRLPVRRAFPGANGNALANRYDDDLVVLGELDDGLMVDTVDFEVATDLVSKHATGVLPGG